jgi:hypothetical protein
MVRLKVCGPWEMFEHLCEHLGIVGHKIDKCDPGCTCDDCKNGRRARLEAQSYEPLSQEVIDYIKEYGEEGHVEAVEYERFEDHESITYYCELARKP